MLLNNENSLRFFNTAIWPISLFHIHVRVVEAFEICFFLLEEQVLQKGILNGKHTLVTLLFPACIDSE